jgi:DNA-binding response OmpR family regulator
MRVTREGKRVDLTPREYSLLELLMRSPGNPVPRAVLMKEIWGEETSSSSSNVVDVYMKYLRDKIDLPDLPKLIQTLRGIGYVISES